MIFFIIIEMYTNQVSEMYFIYEIIRKLDIFPLIMSSDKNCQYQLNDSDTAKYRSV